MTNPIYDLPKIDNLACRIIDPMTLEIDTNEQIDLNFIFARLTEQGIKIKSMRNKTNRLEQLFMDLVEGNKA